MFFKDDLEDLSQILAYWEINLSDWVAIGIRPNSVKINTNFKRQANGQLP